MEQDLRTLLKEIANVLEAGETERTSHDFSGFKRHAERMTERLIDAMYPHHAEQTVVREQALIEATELLESCLRSLQFGAEHRKTAVRALLKALPQVKALLDTDLAAAYQGDPAARGIDEIILCYPAFLAISTYRLAHVLYTEHIPLLPRVMTEYAHRHTGIDIHPGATIGEAFFIDHGTGVVIGETTTIGKQVKIYQHVTLGAKSFDVDETGALVKGIKRHPDIGDRVVIYSGATILGGETQIGNDCVIGGSVWLTHSVEAGKMVLARATVTDAPLKKDIMHVSVSDYAML